MSGQQNTDRSDLLNTGQAATYLGVSPSTLEHWRMLGKGPTWVSLGVRLKRYRKFDLDQWIEQNVMEACDG